MGVHDWSQVDAGVFHDFHTVWIANIRTALNEQLPEGYYALAEQHAGEAIADVLTLHASPGGVQATGSLPPDTGGVAVAAAPPRVRTRETVEGTVLSRRRTLAIRHVSGHRLVAMLEIVSPGNKDRPRHVADFAAKAVDALDAGVHLLVIDLFPPSTHDAHGMHTAIRQRLEDSTAIYAPPPAEPLTLASYVAGAKVEIYLEHLAVGGALNPMPLFLRPDRYVEVPLAATYDAAYRGMPKFWREVLEGRPPT